MLRLRDFLSRRGDSLAARGVDRRGGARPAAPRRRGRGPWPGTGRLHRAVRAEPAARLRRDGDHLSALASRRPPAEVAGEVLRVRAALHLRDQGSGGTGGDARAGPVAGRPGAAQQAQDRRVLSAGEADRGGSVRPAHHPPRIARGRLRRRPPVRRTLGHRQERVRARPGRAGPPPGGGRRGAGDPPRQRHPDRTGARAGRASHGDPGDRPDRHPGPLRGARRCDSRSASRWWCSWRTGRPPRTPTGPD